MRELLYQFNPWWEAPYRIDAVRREAYLRRLRRELPTRDIVFLVGLRRVGKTTLMHQLVEELLATTAPQHILYASLDHPALHGHTILDVVQEFRTLHGLPRRQHVHLFLDEVHDVPGFERELKALHDHEQVKVVASGSSSLVLRQQGAHLTGRHRTIPVHPLDFTEFLAFRGREPRRAERYLLESHMEEYLRVGGMPEHVLRGDTEVLTALVDSILYKDIVARYGVRQPDLLRKLFLLLAERIGKRLTYSKLGRVLGVTTDTVKQWVAYLEETYLVHIVPRHARSLNARIYSPKKVYLADTGLRNAYTGLRDAGAMAENAVLLHLAKQGSVAYYHEGNREIDFVQDDTAWEVKYKTAVTADEIRPLAEAPFRRRVLVTRRALGEAVPGVETTTLPDLLSGPAPAEDADR